jgi:hypothetical protein
MSSEGKKHILGFRWVETEGPASWKGLGIELRARGLGPFASPTAPDAVRRLRAWSEHWWVEAEWAFRCQEEDVYHLLREYDLAKTPGRRSGQRTCRSARFASSDDKPRRRSRLRTLRVLRGFVTAWPTTSTELGGTPAMTKVHKNLCITLFDHAELLLGS